jgi:hypothetical protein
VLSHLVQVRVVQTIAERVSKGVLLVRSPAVDAAQMRALIEKSLAQENKSPRYAERARELLEYRLGQDAAAVEWFGKCRGKLSPLGNVAVELYLAAAQERLKHAAEARQIADGALWTFDRVVLRPARTTSGCRSTGASRRSPGERSSRCSNRSGARRRRYAASAGDGATICIWDIAGGGGPRIVRKLHLDVAPSFLRIVPAADAATDRAEQLLLARNDVVHRGMPADAWARQRAAAVVASLPPRLAPAVLRGLRVCRAWQGLGRGGPHVGEPHHLAGGQDDFATGGDVHQERRAVDGAAELVGGDVLTGRGSADNGYAEPAQRCGAVTKRHTEG